MTSFCTTCQTLPCCCDITQTTGKLSKCIDHEYYEEKCQDCGGYQNLTCYRTSIKFDPLDTLDGKADTGKPDMNLVDRYFPNALGGVARVCEFGLKKYSIDSWRDVPDALRRYKSAMRRHQLAIEKGETTDPESGELHVDHVAWNALAISELTKGNTK